MSHDFTELHDFPELQPDAYRHSPEDPRLAGIDPSFVIDFASYDDIDESTQRWTTWYDVEPLCRGPEPRPDWVVTSRGAIDTELGILKTGKEADAFLRRARRPRATPTTRSCHGGQALPRHRPPHLPPLGRSTPRAAR